MYKYKALFAKVFVAAFLLICGVLATSAIHAQGKAESHIPVCPGPAAEKNARCHARVIVDQGGTPKVTTLPAGYGPAQFRGAYNLATTTSASLTIAIVDAYDDPNIKSDLDKYNATYGLPVFPSCSATVTTGCFQKVNQRGGTSYPRADAGWALEISLDVEVAHGICPSCKLLLVEADSSSYANLMTAVDTAVGMGAKVVSNSYGSNEFSGETGYDSHLNIPGVAFTFSSGDSGYGSSYPAASKYVTAVGGTTLNLSGNSYVSESTWNGAGSGCSAYELKPSWQVDAGCAHRTIADVSADADPNTGAAVYDTVRYYGKSGWYKVGGTSLASPIIAAVYALSGNTGNATISANSLPYSNVSGLHDVVTGNNGNCGSSYLCVSGVGYDGPTGLGTPIGAGSF